MLTELLGPFAPWLAPWLPFVALLLHLLLIPGFMIWVLMTKAEATSAVAWLLVLAFLPYVGVGLFILVGNQHVSRPLRRKRQHRAAYQGPPDPAGYVEATRGDIPGEVRVDPDGPIGDRLSALARRFGASAVTQGNRVDLYREGVAAFDAMFAAIVTARSHIHVETFILHDDGIGRQLIDALSARARAGVEVRLLYDAIGSYDVPRTLLRPLEEVGGKTRAFLPIALLRRRVQINLRNHRKILVVDGTTGFIGGLNFGDEYLGKSKRYGFWRDTHLRLTGPGVVDLQRVFAEDWNFASGETLDDEAKYFTPITAQGPSAVQIVDSGPDQEIKAIREVLFAAILKARHRLWIASPYFVPDSGLLDALRLAAYSGVDVRLLGQLHADKWMPQFAARYYWAQALRAGVRVFQYAPGMMHSKVLLIDDTFASVGSANLDNRSMYLNFEANCLIYSSAAAHQLEAMFLVDFAESIEIDPKAFETRPMLGRLAENACRLFSPIL